jgi:hypothetical protein
MKKLLRYSKLLQVMAVIFLIACMVLPIGIAYAETPLSLGIVAASAGADGLGSPFQHHSFIDDGVMWVFYQADDTDQVVGSWSEDGVTWVALPAITACEATTAETVGGQFDSWFNAADDTVRFAVVNTSLNNSAIKYCSYAVDSVAHTLTPESTWRVAVAGVANVSYRNPTICVNNDQVFITYGYETLGTSDVYVMSTNNSAASPWVADVGFPMFNLSKTGNKSEYGSVIPLFTSNNVSVQWATSNGSVEKLEQAVIYWNGSSWVEGANYAIDTSGWYLPSDQEWNYNTVSIPTAINVNDVAIQCIQTNGSGYRVFFNRRANESDAWGSSGYYARNFGAGGWAKDYVGAMGIRNAIYALVYSGWDVSGGSTAIYSNDFDVITGDWAGIANVATDANIPFVSTMSDYTYDPSGTGYIGFIYGDSAPSDDLMYGLYGPAVPTPVGDAGTTILQLILPLLIAVLTLILILKKMPEAGVRGMIIAIGLSAIVGAIAFQIVKLIVDML